MSAAGVPEPTFGRQQTVLDQALVEPTPAQAAACRVNAAEAALRHGWVADLPVVLDMLGVL